MKYKAYICMAIALCMILVTFPAIAAEVAVNVSPINEKGIFSISGQAEKYLGQKASIRILRPEATEEDFEQLTMERAKEVLLLDDQVEINSDGSFVFQYTLDPAASQAGWYKLRIGVSGWTADADPRTLLFYNSTLSEKEELKGLFNSNNLRPEQVKELFDKYDLNGEKPILNVDATKIASFSNVFGTLFLDESKAAGAFTSLDDIAKRFLKVYDIAKIAAGGSGIAEYIAESELLSDYADENTAAYFEEFNKLWNKNLAEFSTCEQTLNAIKGITALAMINKSSRDDVHEILECYHSYLGVSLNGDYQTVGANVVALELAYKNYETLAAFRLAFEAAIKPQVNKTPSFTGSSGSSGRGGSSSGGQATRMTLPNNENPVVSPPPVTQHIQYTDLGQYPWAAESIQELTAMGVVSGMGDSVFGGGENVTREQFVKMLVIAFNLKGGDKTDFEDVDKESWAYQYIQDAFGTGVVKGMQENLFGIGLPITRQDLAVMVFRAMRYAEIVPQMKRESIVFNDAQEISEYAIEATDSLYKVGIINGTGDNYFSPLNYATRAEAAKIIYGAVCAVIEQEE